MAEADTTSGLARLVVAAAGEDDPTLERLRLVVAQATAASSFWLRKSQRVAGLCLEECRVDSFSSRHL